MSKAAMSKAAQLLRTGDGLLIVDVQNDFCPGGALPIGEGDKVVAPLNEWIAAALAAHVPIYASRDWHPAEHMSFREQGGPWPSHCVQDTKGAAFHPALKLPASAITFVKGTRFDKDQYSALEDTGITGVMKRHGVERLFVGGLALDVCVKASVLDAIRAGFSVHLIEDAARPVTVEGGRAALAEMKEKGVEVA